MIIPPRNCVWIELDAIKKKFKQSASNTRISYSLNSESMYDQWNLKQYHLPSEKTKILDYFCYNSQPLKMRSFLIAKPGKQNYLFNQKNPSIKKLYKNVFSTSSSNNSLNQQYDSCKRIATDTNTQRDSFNIKLENRPAHSKLEERKIPCELEQIKRSNSLKFDADKKMNNHIHKPSKFKPVNNQIEEENQKVKFNEYIITKQKQLLEIYQNQVSKEPKLNQIMLLLYINHYKNN